MTGVMSASTLPGRANEAYVTGIREFFGIDHRFPPKLSAVCRQSRRIFAASLGASSGRLDEKARGAQTSTPTRLANPQAGQALPRKSLKNRIKALSSRERLVNVQE